MGASSFSPLPEHYDAISHKRDLALKALRLGDRLLEEAAGVLDGEAEDYNTNPQPSGYRGLHQGLLVKLDRTTWFPFEVQFLTFLQADWASKEHLVYENPAKYPASLHERLRELSSILHDISVSFDDLRDQIAGIG